MNAEIICIGTELLLGQTLDTNASYLAAELADLGINLYHKATVGDNLGRIVPVLRQAWERADLIILSGGLGPTQDDLTREALAGLLGEKLEFREDAWQMVQSFFDKNGRQVPESNRRQAMFPKSAQALVNPLGTAPGVLVERSGKILYAFPGVPRELKVLWESHAKPFLTKVLFAKGNPVLTSLMVRLVGIGESAMEEQIMDLIKSQTAPTIAPYVGRGDVCLRITANGESEEENRLQIDGLFQKVKQRLGQYIYGFDSDNLETIVGEQLKVKGWTLALAESCTGGLLAHRITNIPGCSAYYLGGINSYSNSLKMSSLGVAEEVLDKYGAVSEETAAAMAEGVKKLTGADVGISVTGIAGPDGGSSEKPVGLVYWGVNLPNYTAVEKRIFQYDRLGNKEAAAQAALTLLWRSLKRM